VATYTLDYVITLRNMSQLAAAALAGNVPIDTSPVDLWGLALSSDNTTPLGGVSVRREIIYTGPAGRAPMLENLNTAILNQALATRVRCDPVQVTP